MKLFNTKSFIVIALLALLGGSIQAQGMMRGESSPGGEGPAMEREYFTVGDDVAEISNTATSAESGMGKAQDLGFGEAVDLEAISEMTPSEMQIAIYNMARENRRLKTELEEKEVLRGEISQLKTKLELMEGGWEAVQN